MEDSLQRSVVAAVSGLMLRGRAWMRITAFAFLVQGLGSLGLAIWSFARSGATSPPALPILMLLGGVVGGGLTTAMGWWLGRVPSSLGAAHRSGDLGQLTSSLTNLRRYFACAALGGLLTLAAVSFLLASLLWRLLSS